MENIYNIVRVDNISIDKNSTIHKAVEVMHNNHQGVVVILDHNKVAGVLTEQNIVELLAKKIDFNQKVINVAVKEIITINVNSSAEYALDLLIDNNIRYLIVTDDEDLFIGILTHDMLTNKLEEDHCRMSQAEDEWINKERMELALLVNNDGIWDWNLLNNSIYFSPRWKEMIGYNESEIPNIFSTWRRRVHPNDFKKTVLDIQNNIKGKTEYFENIHRLKHKNGSWIWILNRGKTLFSKEGKAIRLIGTHTDITEEKDLQIKYAKQAQILEEIHDGVVSTDLEGFITGWNSGAGNLMGYSSDEAVGKHITMLYREEDIPAMYENIENLMQIGKINIETSLIKKTKEPINVKLCLSLLRGDNNEPVETIGYVQDITKQKQAQDEIRRLNTNLQNEVNIQLKQIREKDNQLLQQSRMAQMGEMLSMIAHQWRQPLAAISSTSSSLELKAILNKIDNDIVQKKAQDISSIAHHLSKTIDDFRDFFKPNKKSIETSYCTLLDSVLKIIGFSITNNNIKLIKELNCHDKFISYPSELQQVILNLIKNAEDALIEQQIKNPYIKISTYKEDNQYILEVSDNAGGIAENIINNIFDPYFTTKTKKDGTGLGLYMSKIIVEEHCNGRLSVVNNSDGVLFKIVLNSI